MGKLKILSKCLLHGRNSPNVNIILGKERWASWTASAGCSTFFLFLLLLNHSQRLIMLYELHRNVETQKEGERTFNHTPKWIRNRKKVFAIDL